MLNQPRIVIPCHMDGLSVRAIAIQLCGKKSLIPSQGLCRLSIDRNPPVGMVVLGPNQLALSMARTLHLGLNM